MLRLVGISILILIGISPVVRSPPGPSTNFCYGCDCTVGILSNHHKKKMARAESSLCMILSMKVSLFSHGGFFGSFLVNKSKEASTCRREAAAAALTVRCVAPVVCVALPSVLGFGFILGVWVSVSAPIFIEG